MSEHDPQPEGRGWILAAAAVGLTAVVLCCLASALAFVVLKRQSRPQLSPRAPFGPALSITASEADIQRLPYQRPPWEAPTSSDTVYAPRATSAKGGYGVIDLGDLRLAVRGLKVELDYDWTAIVTPEGGGTTSGSSSRETQVLTEFRREGRESIYRVFGFEYRVADGVLTLEPPEGEPLVLPIRGERRVVFVDRDGANPVVRPWTGSETRAE